MDGAHIAIVVYSGEDGAYTVFDFDEFTLHSQLATAIKSMSYPDAGAFMNNGFEVRK